MDGNMTADGRASETTGFKWKNMEWLVFLISGGFLLLFVVASLINSEFVSNQVNRFFGLSCTYFGAYWQWLLLLNFLIAMGLAVSRYGDVKAGQDRYP